MVLIVKRIFGFALLALLAYGAYSWYAGSWDVGSSVSRVGEYVGNVTGIVGGKVKDQANSAAADAKESAMDYVTGVIGETIDSTAGYLKVQAAKALSSLGETAVKQSTSISGTTSSTVPGPTGPTFQTPPPPAAILITPGTPFVVAVNHDATYSISWGDGLTDSGLSPSGDSVFVSHSWNTEGDYSVKVTMKNGDGAVSQVFPVRVYR